MIYQQLVWYNTVYLNKNKKFMRITSHDQEAPLGSGYREPWEDPWLKRQTHLSLNQVSAMYFNPALKAPVLPKVSQVVRRMDRHANRQMKNGRSEWKSRNEEPLGLIIADWYRYSTGAQDAADTHLTTSPHITHWLDLCHHSVQSSLALHSFFIPDCGQGYESITW